MIMIRKRYSVGYKRIIKRFNPIFRSGEKYIRTWSSIDYPLGYLKLLQNFQSPSPLLTSERYVLRASLGLKAYNIHI